MTGTVVGRYPVPPSQIKDSLFRLKITSVNGIEVQFLKQLGEKPKDDKAAPKDAK
jgi:hypothetical protein